MEGVPVLLPIICRSRWLDVSDQGLGLDHRHHCIKCEETLVETAPGTSMADLRSDSMGTLQGALPRGLESARQR